jgi:hypothetical protein
MTPYSYAAVPEKEPHRQFPIEMFVIIIFLDYHHILVLKIGVVILLIGTYIPELDFVMEQDERKKLLTTDLANNLIQAEILKGTTVLIPRIDLSQQEALLGLTIKRRQFPIIPLCCHN